MSQFMFAQSDFFVASHPCNWFAVLCCIRNCPLFYYQNLENILTVLYYFICGNNFATVLFLSKPLLSGQNRECFW